MKESSQKEPSSTKMTPPQTTRSHIELVDPRTDPRTNKRHKPAHSDITRPTPPSAS